MFGSKDTAVVCQDTDRPGTPMKRTLPVLPSLIMLVAGCSGKTVDIVFPENFSGQATIYFDVPDAATLPEDAGTVRIEFPSNGVIFTRSEPPSGTYRFWLRSKSGVAVRVETMWWYTISDEPASREDPTIGVRGPIAGLESTLIDGRDCATTTHRFLVGTRAQILDLRETDDRARDALGCTNP